jgi:hypothetical protein
MQASASSPAAERIRLALNLEAVALSKIPESTVEKLAEICETKLCRFPRKLISISDDKKAWGGSYRIASHFKINSKMTHEETVQVFVHEFGHAVHYAICDMKADAAHYKKTVTGIRDDNIKRLTGIYWKASQYVPALNDLFLNHKYASCISVRNMYDRMHKDKQLIPEKIFNEFNYSLFSRYSLKNYNEYFCENFSAWIISAFPSEFARAIGKLAEKHAIRPDTEKYDSGMNIYRQSRARLNVPGL